MKPGCFILAVMAGNQASQNAKMKIQNATANRYGFSYNPGAPASGKTPMSNDWTNKWSAMGMVALKPGDFVELAGEPCLVVHVNDCGARVQPVSVRQMELRTRFGQKVVFDKARPVTTISRHVEAACRIPEGQVDSLLAKLETKSAVRGEFMARREKEIISMARRAKETKEAAAKAAKQQKSKKQARGGLAAEQAQMQQEAVKPADKPEADKPSKARGGHPALFGYSVSAVFHKLGAAGVSTKHARAILEARGVSGVSGPCLNTYLSHGRSGKYGTSAPLTDAQVAELKSSALEPA